MQHLKPLVAVLAMTAFGQAYSQEASRDHRASVPPDNARFEIVQSQLTARRTFRLDRYAGRVDMLVTAVEGGSKWERMEVVDLPAVSTPTRPRFQLFASGIAARYTFLLDADTGKTWALVSRKRTMQGGAEHEVLVWQPVAQ